MRTTLKFLSEKSNLSTSAVSLILNNKPVRVSAEKKELVKELAKTYRYRPNRTAIALVTKKTQTIGLMLPDIVNPFFATVAGELDKLFADSGYSLVLCNLHNSADAQKKYLRTLEEKRVDALIVCVTDEKDECDMSTFYDGGVPVIFFDRFYPGAELVVSIDNSEGARQAVGHLVAHGHRNIAIITGPKNYRSATSRIEGYKKALADAGIEINEDYILDGDYTFEGGVRAAEKIIARPEVTAVFAGNDLMAYGAIKKLQENGVRVPDDVSFVGFDDLVFSEMISPPLTSVRQNFEELAARIYDITMRALSSDIGKVHEVVKTRLVVRGSVKKIGD